MKKLILYLFLYQVGLSSCVINRNAKYNTPFKPEEKALSYFRKFIIKTNDKFKNKVIYFDGKVMPKSSFVLSIRLLKNHFSGDSLFINSLEKWNTEYISKLDSIKSENLSVFDLKIKRPLKKKLKSKYKNPYRIYVYQAVHLGNKHLVTIRFCEAEQHKGLNVDTEIYVIIDENGKDLIYFTEGWPYNIK